MQEDTKSIRNVEIYDLCGRDDCYNISPSCSMCNRNHNANEFRIRYDKPRDDWIKEMTSMMKISYNGKEVNSKDIKKVLHALYDEVESLHKQLKKDKVLTHIFGESTTPTLASLYFRMPGIGPIMINMRLYLPPLKENGSALTKKDLTIRCYNPSIRLHIFIVDTKTANKYC